MTLRGDLLTDIDNGVALVVTEDGLKAFITVRNEESVNEKLINDLLRQKNIKYGIDREIIEDLLENPRKGTFIVATGQPPREGRDGYMQYLFTTGARTAPQDAPGEKNIDFREIFNVPSVNANAVLAVYHPAEKGEDGRTVTGEVIPARKVTELAVRAGKGAALSPDGLSVVSTVSGRPWVKKLGKNVTVGVEAVYRHEGDVDIKSGNLRFNGDVFITGNVMENMIVEVTGNLKVAGFISRASVHTTGNLEVMKVVTASKIVTGSATASHDQIEKKLRSIEKSIAALDAAARQLQDKLRQGNKNVQFGQVIITLLDKKFTGLKKQVQEFNDLVYKHNYKPPRQLEQAIQSLSHICGIQALKLQNLQNIRENLATALDYLGYLEKNEAHIIAHSVWNSDLEATGSIKIIGQGAFNSRLTALGNVEIKGVFRGGEIYAAGGVKAGEIGGPMGIRTHVRTAEGSIIRAARVYSGSVLQVGTRVFTAREDYNMVVARVNEHGEIVLH